MDVLRRGRKAGVAPIEIKGLRVRKIGDRPVAEAVVEFRNVVGSLRAPGRACGFTVNDGDAGEQVYDVSLRGSRAHVRACLAADQLSAKWLSYGFGANPHCNITDEADRSLPVFGPLPLGKAPSDSA
jgi:hypothetical protein